MIAFQSFAVGLAALVLKGWTRRRSVHLTPKDLTHTNMVTAKRWHRKIRPKVELVPRSIIITRSTAILKTIQRQAVITEPQRHALGPMTYDLAFRNDGTLSDGRIVSGSASTRSQTRLISGRPAAILARSYKSSPVEGLF